MTDAKKAPTAKPAAKASAKKKCSAKACQRDSYCKGMCAAHYARERRKDPVELEKTRAASRASYAKRKAASEASAKK